MSPGSAPMRLVDVMFFWGSCLRAPQFPRPLLLHFQGIGARFISAQSLTLLLVGRAGWLHLQRRQNHLLAPPARPAPLRSSPSSALPEGSSHGSRERKPPFQAGFTRALISLIIPTLTLMAKLWFNISLALLAYTLVDTLSVLINAAPPKPRRATSPDPD